MNATRHSDGGIRGLGFIPWWDGTGRLAPLYWGWGVVASLVIALVVALPPLMGWAGHGWALLGSAVLITYTGWILVAVFQCADNIDDPAPLGVDRAIWSAMARVLTVGWAINAIGLCVLMMQMVGIRSPFDWG
jgi:hypothetical protein